MTNATKNATRNVTKNATAPAETKKVKSQQKGATKAKREIKNVKRASVDSHGDIVPVDAKKVSVNSTKKANVTANAQKNMTTNATSNISKNSTVQANVTSLVNMTSNKSLNALAAKNVTMNTTKNVTANATKNVTANTTANATKAKGLIAEAFDGAVNLESMTEKITDINKHGHYAVGSFVQMNKTSNVSLDANTTVQANATSNVSKFTGIGSTKGQIELQQQEASQKSAEQMDEEIDSAVYSGEKTKVVADIEKITNKIKTHGDSLMQKQSKIQEMMMKMSEQI